MNRNDSACRYNSERYDGYFRTKIEEGLSQCFSIAVVKHGEIVYEFWDGSFPPDSPFDRSRFDRAPRFNIGSVTKPVTGALIVKLMEAGELTIDDPVKAFIPEFAFDDICIFHLLTHSAGVGGGFPGLRPESLEELAAYKKQIYDMRERSFPPGEDVAYFTFGYTILMDIIEKVTGKPLEEYARETLFDPLHMERTTYDITSLTDGQLADEFVLPWNRKEGRYLTEVSHVPVTGDGEITTTAHDLVRFGSLFVNGGACEAGSIFSKPSVDFMLKPFEMSRGKFKTAVFFAKGGKDGYGCFGDLSSPEAVGHTGYTG